MQTEETGDQITFFDQDLWFSKMSKDCFPQTMEKTSESSSKRRQELPTVVPQFLDCRPDRLGLTQEPLWDLDGLSLGGYMTDSFGESPSSRLMAEWSREVLPNAVEDSVLSQILEENPPPRYSLSPRACQGILNRAGKRGKELPKILHDALMEQVTQSRSGGGRETDSKGRGAGKGALVQTELSGTLGVTQDQTLVKVYGMSPFESNAMKSKNPESGIYEAETSRTLDLNGGNPACNQGGMMIVEPVCYSQGAFGQFTEDTTSATLKQSGGDIGGGSETLISSELCRQGTSKE